MAIPGKLGAGQKGIGSRRYLVYLSVSLAVLLFGPILIGGLGSWLGARFSGLFFADSGSPAEEKLRNDIMVLMLENSILREEALKAEEYRTLLGITRTDEREAVPARVLYRSEGLVTGTMVVDKGRRDGVFENSVCISAEGLVGVVSQVGEATSEVLPITNPSVNVSCVTWPSGAYGILQSSSEGSLSLVYVDLTSEVQAGDQVLTSRYGGVFPDGLLAGRVIGISSGEPGLALKLDVEPAVDFQSTGEVLILLPEDVPGNQ
ncbi:MAG: rod shape-determining protein MreC [Candidatus Fermentibacteraceae bacterium]|nr:rod shape-determining protein MreC [Candidatus Fermentibacteraceae bacterium]